MWLKSQTVVAIILDWVTICHVVKCAWTEIITVRVCIRRMTESNVFTVTIRGGGVPIFQLIWGGGYLPWTGGTYIPPAGGYLPSTRQGGGEYLPRYPTPSPARVGTPLTQWVLATWRAVWFLRLRRRTFLFHFFHLQIKAQIEIFWVTKMKKKSRSRFLFSLPFLYLIVELFWSLVTFISNYDKGCN